jgi:hypothetical protein
LALAIIVLHRLYILFATDFPINDGGLFAAFVNGVSDNFPGLPHSVRYNDLTIPFAYPPLSFWLAAIGSRIGIDTIGIVHAAPIVMNILFASLFAALLTRGHSKLFAGCALLFFAANLRSLEWLVMGGGLSRCLGALFLLASLLAVRVPDGRPAVPLRRMALAGAAIGGAILSHLEWGIDAAAAVVLARAIGSRSIREFIAGTTVAASVAVLIVAPWIAFVWSTFGFAPFLAAGNTADWGLGLGHLARLAVASLSNPFLAIGACVVLWRRAFFWPGFILIAALLTPRHSPSPLVLPMAALSAHGLIAFARWLARLTRPAIAASVAVAASAIVLLMPLDRWFLADVHPFRPLPSAQRQAMAWVRQQHPGESFFVLTDQPWWYDAAAEWFPILAQAHSINTVQGWEWLPPRGEFRRRYRLDLAVKASRTCDTLLDRMAAFGRPHFIWTTVNRQCFDPRFRKVFDNRAVAIYAVPAGVKIG